jgi:prepilin-type N-terminal cleavage/methylation domain-containing protein
VAPVRKTRYFEATLLTSPRAVPPSNRGFTLVELLMGVAITGILAMIAVVSFRRYMSSAHSGEAASVIEAIRSAQEAYRAENHVYLNVSAANGGVAWYPLQTPGQMRTAFTPALHPSHADATRWQDLAPSVNESVMFAYLTNAGVSGSIMPALQLKASPDLSQPQTLDWYSIQALGDVNGNGVFSHYATTSSTGELVIENEGE